MSYKTILVHVATGAAAKPGIRLATALARQAGSHLVGCAPTGVSRFIPPQTLATAGHAVAARCEELRAHAFAALAEFEGIAREEGVASVESRLADDEAGAGLALHARYADLVVVGQPDRSSDYPLLPHDLPAYLLLNAGRPLLLAPPGPAAILPGADAVLAWNGSAEATRAASAALPLLRAARRTTVLGLDDDRSFPGADACMELAAWLGRHGVAARVEVRSAGGDSGAALLAAAAGQGAGLLVMGGYGHSRAREFCLGGATRTVLAASTMPVLMAH